MKIIYPPYVLKRMIERNITVADVRDVLENGELIEEHKTDSPPRYLMLGWSGSRPIHVANTGHGKFVGTVQNVIHGTEEFSNIDDIIDLIEQTLDSMYVEVNRLEAALPPHLLNDEERRCNGCVRQATQTR